MVAAMKAKQKEQLSTIRMLKAAIQNEALKKPGTVLSSEDELSVLSRELKQRKESRKEFEKADRQDLVDKLDEEIKVVEVYLPAQMSEEEVSQIVQETIAEIGATVPADMGKVMSALMPKVKGKADGGLVNQLVKKFLS